jgi:thiol-disulfide isomerase/thioredoxin
MIDLNDLNMSHSKLLTLLFIVIFQNAFSQVKIESITVKVDTLKKTNSVSDKDSNKITSELAMFRSKEAQAVSDLWQKHGSEIGKNDSITLLNKRLCRALNDRTILFLRKYLNDPFSFKIFREQVVASSLVFMRKDTGYFRSLIDSFKSVFPDVYTESSEGQQLIRQLQGLIKACEANQQLLPFSLKDTAGHIVRSADFKGKYLLLDFWASWCGPCRANNPVLKKIVDKYRHSKFELVSISMDDNADKWKAAINKDSMNWINISDLKALNSNVVIEYGISAYPTYILIDPKGKVILRTENEIDRIEEKLETIFE